jgi:hypothetical protein
MQLNLRGKGVSKTKEIRNENINIAPKRKITLLMEFENCQNKENSHFCFTFMFSVFDKEE